MPGWIDKDSVTKLDRSKQTHIAAYERFLNEQCKISFTWYISDDSKTAKDRVRTFCSVYQTKHVTPYVHVFAMHVPQFIRLYRNITKFTQHGLEKLNDLTTKQYLRSTNHRETEALVQLIENRNRLEELEAKGYERQVRTCRCSNCGQIGHNKHTYPGILCHGIE